MIYLTQSKNIHHYQPILEGLTEDFDYEYYHDILMWCNIITNNHRDYHWQVYLIKSGDEVIGICGLYSLYPHSVEELWLGWFGIIPSMRNQGAGQYALDWMKEKAKSIGCKKLMSYVGADGGPLGFYFRNGFRVIGTVENYLIAHPELTMDSFGDKGYHIIECNLLKS